MKRIFNPALDAALSFFHTELAKVLAAGTKWACPFCSQDIQSHPWNVATNDHGVWVHVMVIMKQLHSQGEEWVDVDRVLLKHNIGNRHNRNWQLLRHWDLIETKRDGRGRTGLWKLTPKATRWMDGHDKIPLIIYTYNKKIHHIEETVMITFTEALHMATNAGAFLPRGTTTVKNLPPPVFHYECRV